MDLLRTAQRTVRRSRGWPRLGLWLACALALARLASPDGARAESIAASWQPVPSERSPLGIRWPSLAIPLNWAKEKPSPFAIIEGVLNDPRDTLLNEAEYVAAAPDGKFRLIIPIRAEETRVTLSIVRPDGSILTERETLRAPRWKEISSSSGGLFMPSPKTRATGLAAELDLSRTTLLQNASPEVTAESIDLGAAYRTPGRTSPLDLRAAGSVSVASFGSSATVGGLYSLDLSANAGLRILGSPDGIELRLRGGVRYTNLFTSNPKYGYTQQMSPELFPSLRIPVSAAASISVAGGVAPVFNGLSLQPFASRETFASLSWQPDGDETRTGLGFGLRYFHFASTVNASSTSATRWGAGINYFF